MPDRRRWDSKQSFAEKRFRGGHRQSFLVGTLAEQAVSLAAQQAEV